MAPSWEEISKAKREDLLNQIPEQWRLQNPVPPANLRRDVTGSFIQQFLTPREIEITETDAVGITQRTTVGEWTAVEVTEAFCHRAAIAHQLVG
jgi:amidase